MHSAGAERHFKLGLLIVHPTLNPAEISRSLGLEAQVEKKAGSDRRAPNGRRLSGTYPDSHWLWFKRIRIDSQWFKNDLVEFINELSAHKAFFRELRSTGGTATVYIQFLGDGYFGDNVPVSSLQQLAELGVEFGIESFDTPQSA